MLYRLLARCHVAALSLRDPRGQGTVEYVALMLLVGAVLTGVVVAAKGGSYDGKGIATTIVRKMKGVLDGLK